ncbi:Rieske (2Fe-2S) protein [Mycobacterium sp. 94-17]|uniref:Rieske (2Fe-2S) protein n=1 Tax=Mycobacterium sp. 94-17 TaxID=2986147 RepID=UPI002D1F8D91|nr:Rieske (2Fe-2S) protein [Mycobacterium sp. 94-17]MEB4209718.1 Rieske (2Fe-2S) protein [Mycobacterium sp. 94-17]
MSTPKAQQPAPVAKPLERAVVARVSDVPPGSRILVEVNGREIGIFNENGRFHALLNHCPHLGGDLCRGEILSLLESDRPGEYRLDESRKFIACPWHGWEFDLATGQSYLDPQRTRTRVIPTEVERGTQVQEELDAGVSATIQGSYGGPGLVKGPFIAEVVKVEIDDEYLVVVMRRR